VAFSWDTCNSGPSSRAPTTALVSFDNLGNFVSGTSPVMSSDGPSRAFMVVGNTSPQLIPLEAVLAKTGIYVFGATAPNNEKRKQMKLLLAMTFAIVTLASFPATILAQTGSQQDLRDYLAGQKFLVTYRQGGPVYGTYFFLTVHLCRSGKYTTFGQSRKQSVLDSGDTGLPSSEQVHRWRDQGRWDIIEFGGQIGVQYLSSAGQRSFYPVRVEPNGQIWVGNGMSVVRQGAAECP
jgi:hypothetical protein